MAKKTFTKEEKQAYFENLRLEWKKSKALAENDMQAEALFREASLNKVSYLSFYFVLRQMRANKLEGIPYVDTKTHKGWTENGYKVKKGEKSKLHGVTWLKVVNGKIVGANPTKEEEESKGFVFPKVYHLFHRNQVEEIEVK
jgi:hypothetical protein